MILDKIENLDIYTSLSERLAKGIDYINKSDFSKIDLGTYKIDGDDVFAMVQAYETKKIENCKLEGHNQYIDIQYVIEGEEYIGYMPKDNQELIAKKENGDCEFYKGKPTLFKFDPSVIGIFYPADLHMPCVASNQISKVRKVVVKVRL